MSTTIIGNSACWIDHAGNRHDYKIVNGTAYNLQTADDVVSILESCRSSGTRLKIHLGNNLNGLAWGDIETGRIGRSTGALKIPLVIHNCRSIGGPGLLDHCIVKIEASSGGRVLYVHPFYHTAE